MGHAFILTNASVVLSKNNSANRRTRGVTSRCNLRVSTSRESEGILHDGRRLPQRNNLLTLFRRTLNEGVEVIL
jgi:hypothetical protein